MKNIFSLRILSILAPLVALLVVSFSCVYDTDDVYDTPVDKNTIPPEIQTVELNLGEDSVFLYDNNSIHFSFKSNLQSIVGVEFLVDGVSKSVVLSDNAIVNVKEGSLDEGIHSLELRIYTPTGSGSISDQLGTENYVFSNSWVLVVSHLRYRKLNTSVKNGILRISSQEYKNPDLKEYIFYWLTGSLIDKEISRSDIPAFADSEYIGEKRVYGIKALTIYGEEVRMGEIELSNEYTAPKCLYKYPIFHPIFTGDLP